MTCQPCFLKHVLDRPTLLLMFIFNNQPCALLPCVLSQPLFFTDKMEILMNLVCHVRIKIIRLLVALQTAVGQTQDPVSAGFSDMDYQSFIRMRHSSSCKFNCITTSIMVPGGNQRPIAILLNNVSGCFCSFISHVNPTKLQQTH